MPETNILSDNRPIGAIHYDDKDDSFFRVGVSNITKIQPYEECGEGGYAVWLAVYRNGEITCRIPAWKVTVEYAKAADVERDKRLLDIAFERGGGDT